MKHLLFTMFISLFMLLTLQATGPDHWNIKLSGQTVKVTNLTGFSKTVNVYDGKDRLLTRTISYKQSFTFDLPRAVTRKIAGKLKFIAVYDEDAYENDLSILRNLKAARQRQRESDALFQAILFAADEYFLKGRIGKVIAAFNVIDALNSSLTPEEKAERIFAEVIKDRAVSQIKNKLTRSAAVGLMAYLDSFDDEEQDADLASLGVVCAVKLAEGETFESKSFANYFQFIPKYTFSVTGAYANGNDLNNFNFVDYSENDEDFVTAYGGLSADVRPISIGIRHRWLKISDKKDTPSTVFSLALDGFQSAVFYADGIDINFPTGQGYQYQHVMMDVEVGYRLGNYLRGVDLNLAFGGGVNRWREVSYETVEGGVLGNIEYADFGKVYPAAQLGLRVDVDLRFVNLYGKFMSGSVFGGRDENSEEENYILGYTNGSIGLSVPLTRRWILK